MRKTVFKRTIVTIVLLSLTLSLFSGTAFAKSGINPKSPEQIALCMTSEPQNSVNITWTTVDTGLKNAKVLVWEKGKSERTAKAFYALAQVRNVQGSTIKGSNRRYVSRKKFYSSSVTGLKPNTTYYYRCGAGRSVSGIKRFTTAPNGNTPFTFIYMSDSQVTGVHTKAWLENLYNAQKLNPSAKFLYIAGDLTDTANNEGQWESFFNEPGNSRYSSKYRSPFSTLPFAAAMGNHDDINDGYGGIRNHFAFASDVNGVPVSYAFDYGYARMIILNMETDYSQGSDSTRLAQTEFLRRETEDAKAQGKWVIVGFHRAIYSGAGHMDDSSTIFNRKYWAPILAGLDIDVVLQGHDHVLSRGFVKADGTKANVTQQLSSRTYVAQKPSNAPLYYVGNTGSSIKFYSPLLNDSWIQPGDPVAPKYGYLDINSALSAGYKNEQGQLLNPGPSTNDDLQATDRNFYRTATFTAVTVTKDTIQFKTYMTGFSPKTYSVVKRTFLYDSLKVTRP